MSMTGTILKYGTQHTYLPPICFHVNLLSVSVSIFVTKIPYPGLPIVPVDRARVPYLFFRQFYLGGVLVLETTWFSQPYCKFSLQASSFTRPGWTTGHTPPFY